MHAIRAIGARASAVHLEDVNPAGESIVIGEGPIDIPCVIAALRDTGLDGLLVLDYEGDFDNMSARLAGMGKSLDTIDRHIAATR